MEWENYLRFVLALVFVLGLLGLLTWAMKRFGLDRGPRTRRGGAGRGGRRLAILEALPVDSRRKLVLVKRDESEHLIMIGGPQDLVVETGIATADRGHEPTAESEPENADATGVLRLLKSAAPAARGGGGGT